MLLLTARDLQPLVDDLTQLEGAFKAIEDTVLQMHRGDGGHIGWVDVPLASEEVLGIFVTSNRAGSSVRLWDSAVRHQLHPHAQLMLLLDVNDARPKALLSAVGLNPLRTSVPAGVGVKHLAMPDARVLGILGSGDQARSLARTLNHALPRLERIQVWNRTRANAERFAAETAGLLGKPIGIVDSPAAALEDADVVAPTTPAGQPDIDAGELKPGAVVVTLTGIRSPGLLATARTVVPTQYRPSPLAIPTRFQGGGGRPPASDVPPIALADVMQGREPARDRPDRIVLFSLAGMYPWDAPIMEWAFAWATARGSGTEIDLD